jgi:hypothetical protein
VRPPARNGTPVIHQRVASLQHETLELERRLSDARASLDRELAQLASDGTPPADADQTLLWVPDQPDGDYTAHMTEGQYHAWTVAPEDEIWDGDPTADGWDGEHAPDGAGEGADSGQRRPSRTEALVNRGRHNAYHPTLAAARKAAIAAACVAALITIIVMALPGGGAAWPASVATVQREANVACQNPDVKAEPSQVNFACAKPTRQILWVFALMTSMDNPRFRDRMTGRIGLEPITPALVGQVALSLNLHHPYDPFDPVDSLSVAARAINNIIGGATLTGALGDPVVQSGLEGHSARCARYTGSPAVIAQRGFPDLCAKPVSRTGEAALVADVFRKWIVGASPQAAKAASVLFEHSRNPGDPQVQAILRQVREGKLAA